MEIWVYTTAKAAEVKAATEVLDRIVAAGVQSNRGVKKGNYHVCRETNMPAMLIELGFISNTKDNTLFDNNFNLYAAAIAKGICAALGVEYREDAANNEPDTAEYTAIAGTAVATAHQMCAYLEAQNPTATLQIYSGLPAVYLAEGEKEGIRGDVAFAQSLLETGNFCFGGDVKPEQNNFCGLGATGGGEPGNSFDTPDLGIRAQVQHLKGYANAEPLNGECIDPRFKWVARGVAPYVEWLGIPDNPSGKGWAAGKDYGASILKILAAILEMPEAPEAPPAAASEIDNTPADWEKTAVEKALSRGAIKPNAAGDLRLHSLATRAEVLVMLDRAGVL